VTRTRLAALLAVPLILAACGGATGSPSGAATPASSASAVASTASVAPGDTASPDASAPADSPTPGDSTSPTASDEPSASPTASAATGGAAACSGSDNNRTFFANFARSISWTVFCPVLPKPWFVDTGKSVLAGGGWLVISYKGGPGGAKLTLSEGSFCTDANGCVPSGADAGSVPFGSKTGLLYSLSGSGDNAWAVVVDGGQDPSWMLETHGLDQATTVALAADLAVVGG
jgi:hypothetical protein